ncbi:MAG: NUDIX hydrolase [Alphaproteobacteria bacterium]|nr:NUDIX hydrolase [Alphaproteobacteria bacterium]
MAQLLMPGRGTAVFPVAVKGIVPHRGQVLLLRNRRDRWDLPGGKIHAGEAVEKCLIREAREEIGLAIEPMRLVDSWVRVRSDKPNTLVLVYLCAETTALAPALSDEHKEWRLVGPAVLDQLALAARYRRAVQRAFGEAPVRASASDMRRQIAR